MLNGSLLPSFLDCKSERIVFIKLCGNNLLSVLSDQLMPHFYLLPDTASFCEPYPDVFSFFCTSGLLSTLLDLRLGVRTLSTFSSQILSCEFFLSPRDIFALETSLKKSEYAVYQSASTSVLFIASQK